ncbi:HNH endonuclease [Thalassomonas actiniarum]|uniref:HNH endonuclease n=1 Tax=Thalassomonas actiniarum TaxID=485447 RepID=A0AAE9YP82_9GAMM|nr:HNH endonuclease [Thalassomonas actiniarum]WDD98490.1 HNH endonuclease [Thalassomonas actiniarum]
MGKEITAAQLATVYELGNLFSANKLPLNQVLETLVGSLNMNETSSTNYMRNFAALKAGKVYKRAMSALSYQVFLAKFYQDLSISDFEKVLHSITLHLQYRWSKSKVKHKEIRKLLAEYQSKLALLIPAPPFANEVTDEVIHKANFPEGAIKQVTVNAYERNSRARAACIAHYGACCQVCKTDFEKVYGNIGKGFIHVHHKIDLASIRESYQVNPIKDLIPVCPNCHAMLHTETPAMTVEKLKSLIKS